MPKSILSYELFGLLFYSKSAIRVLTESPPPKDKFPAEGDLDALE